MKTQTSSDGTIKTKFNEGHSTILIPRSALLDKNKPTPQFPTAFTLCLSSQIGCPMGCTFCLSGKIPYQRNLTLKELKEQIETTIKHISIEDLRTKQNTKGKNNLSDHITSIVFMGMGEPLLNLDNILKFCEWLNEEYNYSFAKICLSTSGIPKKMQEIINYKYPIQLALSLHSPRQEIRNQIMPNLKQYPIKDLIEVCHEYNKKYKQKIMIEYLMIKDLTDTDEDLQNLINYKLAKYTNFNLIPLNGSPSTVDRKPSTPERTEFFKEKLREAGYKCFIRTSTGQDIEAACGMLK
ncbi:MAG: radical SAM protein [Nanoarchaeota archaeon]|jgi:23S rRNA (adenine2503-C2)-methyltransferase|nr:radical SAM protein [Nanoarchaeota archaeon]